jgi:competence protein ComEA
LVSRREFPEIHVVQSQLGAKTLANLGRKAYPLEEKAMKKLFLALVAFMMSAGLAFAGIDINKASEAELDAVKGIGPVKAKAIIEERTKNGNFKDLDDAGKRVKGIGDATVAGWKKNGDVNVGGKHEPKAVAAKKDDAKKDAPKSDAKKDAAPKSDAKKDAAPKADAKKDEMKKDAPKADAKKDDAKKDAPKADAKKDDMKKDAKKDEMKKDAPKADAKKDAPKADAKKDEMKKDAPKADAKEAPKAEDKKK